MRNLRSGFSAALLVVVPSLVACQSGPEKQADADPAQKASAASSSVKIPAGPLTVQIFASSEENGSVNSYLVMGVNDALLIDAQLVESETKKLVEMVKNSGRTLKTVYLTHPHPDHFMGLKMVKREFPDAAILALPAVGDGMSELFEKYKAPLNKFFPGDVADGVIETQDLEGEGLELEGIELKILSFGPGEGGHMTAVHIPANRALFPADMVYNRVHPWLNELRIDEIYAHIEAVRAVADVDVIYPGHGDPMSKDEIDAYKAYVDYVVARAQAGLDAKALIDDVSTKYPEYKTMAGLRFTAPALVEHFKKQAPAASGE